MRVDGGSCKLVVVFFGMTATGKSFIAKALAKKKDWPYFNSDIVRKELAGIDPESHGKTAINDGIYAPAFTRRVYDELICMAEQVLSTKNACAVILDASYQSLRERDLVRRLLGQKYRVIFIHCICPEEVVKKRLVQRQKDPRAVSEGRWEVYLAQKRNFQPPEEIEAGTLVVLETDKKLAEIMKVLERSVGSAAGKAYSASR